MNELSSNKFVHQMRGLMAACGNFTSTGIKQLSDKKK